ncbi:MAG TPA: APC family permease [Terriglobia bacterium]|nr:APC family permease [Terriglobia bacterium]
MSTHENNNAQTPAEGAQQPQLRRRLGILNATSINMSNMIGIGPFITVPIILSTMGGPQALLAWFAGAVLAIADGLVISELGAALPGSGGTYVFLRDSYNRENWGKLMAWLFAWEFLFFGPLEIASGTVGMTQYMTFLWPGLAGHAWRMKFVAAAIAIVVMITLYRKIGDVARLMLVLWITTLVTTGWVIVTGLIHMNYHMALDFPPGAFHLNWAFVIGLGNGTIVVIYNYLGYYQVCYLGDEVKRPERTIPYAVIISILAVTVIDFLLSFSFVSVVPWRDMVKPGSLANLAVASVFMEKIYGHWAAILLTAMILFTAFASVFALMLGYSRIPYAAARDGLFFGGFGKLHAKGEFPNRSLVLVGVLAAIASMFSLGEIITGLMVARILVQFVGHTIGLFVLRGRKPRVRLPFKMWLYPFPAILALVGWLYIFGSSAFQPGGWKFMVYAFTTICAGICGYFILAYKKRIWPMAPREQ